VVVKVAIGQLSPFFSIAPSLNATSRTPVILLCPSKFHIDSFQSLCVGNFNDIEDDPPCSKFPTNFKEL
jgi:hypothetical protein